MLRQPCIERCAPAESCFRGAESYLLRVQLELIDLTRYLQHGAAVGKASVRIS
jgi:hypothetical protein